jgi:peptidoglycan/LPS O-acetylase OafA/YrhL
MTFQTASPAKTHWLDRWHVNPTSNREYDFIDGLRGIAILMVLVCHHVYINPKAGTLTYFFGALATACGGGVELFFALSGFLISWPFWKRKISGSPTIVPPGYALRRFWKIYPPLALSVILFGSFLIWQKGGWSNVLVVVEWLTGIAFLIPVSGKLNPVMWTLVVEVQFYIILPLLFLGLKNVSVKTCFWLITFVFLIVPILFHAVTGWYATFQPDINSHFPAALNFFYFGILVAGLDCHGLLKNKKSCGHIAHLGWILWLIALFIAAGNNTRPEDSSPTWQEVAGWLEIIGSGFLLFNVANPRHSLAKLLCVPQLRWCGIISYEWYLFHQPVILWSRHHFGPAEGNVGKYTAIVGGSLLFSTVLAALIYRFFSLPILKYGRKRATVKPTAIAGEPDPLSRS